MLAVYSSCDMSLPGCWSKPLPGKADPVVNSARRISAEYISLGLQRPGDMYSAGILLAELATGSVPFPENDLSQQDMSDEDYTAHTASIVQQSRDKSWVRVRFWCPRRLPASEYHCHLTKLCTFCLQHTVL